jgi:DNA topoisomerase-1
MAGIAVTRGYATIESRAFNITDIGTVVIDQLSKFFPFIVDINFTKEMEEHLDNIAHNSED